jgi:hypothetical protein
MSCEEGAPKAITFGTPSSFLSAFPVYSHPVIAPVTITTIHENDRKTSKNRAEPHNTNIIKKGL